MKFVDVKNDLAFRKIFGNENKKEALLSFLNAVLCLENDYQIKDVTIVNPYQFQALQTGKVTIVDVKAKDQQGNEYIVEMQVAPVDGFHKRVLYYASKSYSAQIDRGDEYKKLNPTFFIGILDFEVTQNPHFISRHIVKDADTNEHFLTDIEFNFIELPKFTKKEKELTSIIDQWVYFIKNAENLEVVPPNVEDKGLKVAYEEAYKHNWTKQELEEYNKIFIREQDEKGRLTYAVNEAKIEGKIEAGYEIATKSIQRGLDNEMIMDITGLSFEQIEALRKQLGK